MSCFAIIPAKSRSTRLPGKNMLPLAGVPMVQRVLETVLSTGIFDEVWVSTDCIEIANICEKSGAKVLFRPEELAQDLSTLNEVCFHWLSSLEQKPDIFCCTFATSVFLTADDYISAKQQLIESCDGVMGVSKYNYPPVQAMEVNAEGHLAMLMPKYEKVQSQNFPDCYVSNGSQYWLRTHAYEKEQTFYLNNLNPYVTDETHILDINTKIDFEMAVNRARELGWFEL